MNKKKLSTPKMVHGVGINDASSVIQKNEEIGYSGGKRKRKVVWICPYYSVWTDMLSRCYSDRFQEKYPTYKGCRVSDGWHTFSVFKGWMEKQDWKGKQLDKDLLFEGNKIYSEDTCVFVSGVVNSFTTDCGSARGEWMIGVYWNRGANKFRSRCRNPFTKKLEHLGYFTSELEAHKAWLKRKLELACELAEIQTDETVAKALINRYTNYKVKC